MSEDRVQAGEKSRQTTLAGKISARGVGLHSGKAAAIILAPAPAGSGIVFERIDLAGRPRLEASWRRVVDTERRIVLARGEVRVSTVEHLLAALYGLGVDNALVRIAGEEVPAFDGSALPFVRLIRRAGVRRLGAVRRRRRSAKRMLVREGGRWLSCSPARGLVFDCQLDFAGARPGRQRLRYVWRPETFAREIAPARTFGFLEELAGLRDRGLARGGTLRNALVISGGRVLNPGGLRFPDEPVRHKILDLIGDLALLGARLQGSIRAVRPGHSLHLRLLRRLAGRIRARPG